MSQSIQGTTRPMGTTQQGLRGLGNGTALQAH
jgi:hypothetical protein